MWPHNTKCTKCGLDNLIEPNVSTLLSRFSIASCWQYLWNCTTMRTLNFSDIPCDLSFWFWRTVYFMTENQSLIFCDGGNIHLCECATVPLNCQLSFLWQGKARQDTSYQRQNRHLHLASDAFLSQDPGILAPIYGSGCLWVTTTHFADSTDALWWPVLFLINTNYDSSDWQRLNWWC